MAWFAASARRFATRSSSIRARSLWTTFHFSVNASLSSARSAFLGAAETAKPSDVAFELVHVHQGDEAVAVLGRESEARRPFALAFVDVRMPPGMDGLQTIKSLWECDPDLQIVICTAFSDYSFEDIVDELRNRARDVLLTQAIVQEEKIDEAEPAEDLLNLEGVERALAFTLASQGIVTRDDLAELATDDLLEITEMEEEEAAALIMKARAHWFEAEQAGEAEPAESAEQA